MAKGSKRKNSKTKKSLTTSKGLKAVENVFDKIIARLPDNVNMDVVKLTQMALGGYAVYVGTPILLKQFLMIQATLGDIITPGPGGDTRDWDAAAIFAQFMRDRGNWFFPGLGDFLTGNPGEALTPEESEKIDEFINSITEEQKIAFACGVAALIPMTPEIIKGMGEVVKGIGEIVPL